MPDFQKEVEEEFVLMKTRKWFSALLAVTVLAAAAIPMTASAAADNISINGVDGLVKNNADEDETFCKFEFSGDDDYPRGIRQRHRQFLLHERRRNGGFRAD